MTPAIEEITRHVPTVAAGSRDLDVAQADLVADDDRIGGALATRHLIELGHRRIDPRNERAARRSPVASAAFLLPLPSLPSVLPTPHPAARTTITGRCAHRHEEPLPLVTVSLAHGRTPEQTRRLSTELTSAVVRSVGAPIENVRVIVTEVAPSHWAAGDITLAERAASRSSSA